MYAAAYPPPLVKDETCSCCCCGQEGGAITFFVFGGLFVVLFVLGLEDLTSAIIWILLAVLFFALGGWLISKVWANKKKEEDYYKEYHDRFPLLFQPNTKAVDSTRRPTPSAAPPNKMAADNSSDVPSVTPLPATEYSSSRAPSVKPQGEVASTYSSNENPNVERAGGPFPSSSRSLFNDAFRGLPTAPNQKRK